MDAAISLARNVINTRYEDIPADALEVSKKQTLDIIACIIGGSTAAGCKEVVELVKEWGGKEESTIIAYGGKVPSPHAAQANATMGDALDFDDTSDTGGVHSATTIIPGCFAIAEQKRRVSGKKFLTAVTLAVDMVERMGLATNTKPGTYEMSLGSWNGWEVTPFYGVFSTAAATGKILGLDEEKMVNALGIAYAQASGNLQGDRDGALTKRLQPGFAARGGVVSALMAERGLTGAKSSLQGSSGLYNICHRGLYNPTALTKDLGKRFEGVNVCFKPYPCCRANHAPIDATLALVKEYHIKPEDVAEVTVIVGPSLEVGLEPMERKRTPKTVVDAQFSIYWTVATAIVYGKVLIKDFTAEAIKNEKVLQIAQKVNGKLDKSFSEERIVGPAIVEIRTNDGRVLSKRVDFPRWGPKNPVDWESLADKLNDCALYAVKPIPKGNLEKLVEMVRRLEELDDVSAIIRLVS